MSSPSAAMSSAMRPAAWVMSECTNAPACRASSEASRKGCNTPVS